MAKIKDSIAYQTLSRVWKNNSKLLITVLTPILLCPLPIVIQKSQAYCAYSIAIIIIYWITECLPLAITSMIPVFIFPVFGILDSNTVSQVYFEDINMLFFGGLVMALSIEITNLHQRIALKAILFMGTDPKWLLLGVMAICGVLSLWISNTASASMMLPIVVEIVKQLIKTNKKDFLPNKKSSRVKPRKTNKVNGISTIENANDTEMHKIERVDAIARVDMSDDSDFEDFEEHLTADELAREEEELMATKDAQSLLKGFCLSIAFSAGMGGTGTLVGTQPNLLLKGHYDKFYPTVNMNFLTYMLFTLPAVFIMIPLSWLALTFLWLPKRYFIKCSKKQKNSGKIKEDPLKKLIKTKYEELGPFSFEQKSVGALFILLILLWVTRDIYFVPGWAFLFPKKSDGSNYTSDTTPSILMLILLVAWPKKNVFRGNKYEHLVSWDTINTCFPWYIVLLGGASLSIARAFEASELSGTVGKVLGDIVPDNNLAILIIIMLFGLVGTELTSNTSMESILLPVVTGLANDKNLNPNYFLIPMTPTVSLAFLLPIATTTNAVVFSSGYITVKDMFVTGVIMKLLGAAVIVLAANTWLDPIFNDPRNFTTTLMANTTSTHSLFNTTTMSLVNL